VSKIDTRETSATDAASRNLFSLATAIPINGKFSQQSAFIHVQFGPENGQTTGIACLFQFGTARAKYLASPDIPTGITRYSRKDTAMTLFSNAQSQIAAVALAILTSSLFIAASVAPGVVA
jgi:hypothetical protein